MVNAATGGTFENSIIPDKAGVWTAKASWNGDTDHSGAESSQASFTVEEAPMSWIWILIVLMIVCVAAVAALILIQRHRIQSPPAPQ